MYHIKDTDHWPPDHAMSSFTATRDIPSPSPSDVNEYRRYLATHQPVTEIEARFLDSTDDLVTLAPPPRSSPTPSRAPSPLSSGAMAAAAAAARDHHYYQALKSTLDAAESTSTSTPAPVAAAPASAAVQGVLSEPEPSSPVPIPGTMHGNSWRTNRGHLRGSSSVSVSHSPSPGLGGLGSAPLHTPRGTGTRPRSSSEAITPRVFTPRSGTPVGKVDAPAAVAPGTTLPTIKVDQPSVTTISVPGEKDAGASSPVVLHVAIALAVAVLLPILTFSTIPGLVGRLIVVILVGMSVAGSVVQSGSVGTCAPGVYSRDLFVSVAVYTGVMAVVAGVL